TPRDTEPAAPEKVPEEPERDGGIPRPMPGPAKVAHQPSDGKPKGLAPLLKELDKNGDDKISLAEGKGSPAEFRELDTNGDGFLPPDELMRESKVVAPELKFQNGRAEHVSEMREREEPYRDKKAYKLLGVKLEAGKTYQIDLTSGVIQPCL